MNAENVIRLQGYLSFDPKIKTLSSDKELGKLRLMCKSERGKLFIDVDIWDDDLINKIRNMQKNQKIGVIGELRSNTWSTSTGEKRTRHVVVAEDIIDSSDLDDK